MAEKKAQASCTARNCPQCGYIITEILTLRCPRCGTKVGSSCQGSCHKCKLR
ncbi:hypothetical protein RDV78_06650 [Bacillota bacterium LX-D]|nr:hypothetical protein [Bacillota bacterium LX-D]